MGLAASQARLLTLTSRMNDLEAQCMSFTSQKLLMAMKQSDRVSRYNAEMDLANQIQGVSSLQTYEQETVYSAESENLGYDVLTRHGYKFDVSNDYKEKTETKGVKEESKTFNNVTKDYLENTIKKDYANATIEFGAATKYAQKLNPEYKEYGSYDTSKEGSYIQAGKGIRGRVANTINTAKGIQFAPQTPFELKNFLQDLNIITVESNGNIKANIDIPGVANKDEEVDFQILVNSLQAIYIPLPNANNGQPSRYDEEQFLLTPDGTCPPLWDGNNEGDYIQLDYTKITALVDPNKNANVPKFTGGNNGKPQYIDDISNPIEWSSITVKYEVEDSDAITVTYGEKTKEGKQLWSEIQSSPTALLTALEQRKIIATVNGQEVAYEDIEKSITETETITTNSNPYGYVTMDYTERNTKRDEVQRRYESDMRALETEEKRIDMNAKQADTQYQACTTEYESVKSLIEKNVDRGFNLFG